MRAWNMKELCLLCQLRHVSFSSSENDREVILRALWRWRCRSVSKFWVWFAHLGLILTSSFGGKSITHWLSDPHLTFIYWAAKPCVIQEESGLPQMTQSSCLWSMWRSEEQRCFFWLTFSTKRYVISSKQVYHLSLMFLEDHSKVDR